MRSWLAAFQKIRRRAPRARWSACFTSDEEIGSPRIAAQSSRRRRAAPRAVFNIRGPGRPTGNVVSGRKGGVFMKMEIAGKGRRIPAAISTDGISAIEELARKITALHAITDLTKGTTVNVGLISGRADRQTRSRRGRNAKSILRYGHAGPSARGRDGARFARIVETVNVPGTSAKLEIAGEFQSRWSKRPDSKASVRALRVVALSDVRPQGPRGEFARRLRRIFRLHGGRRHADHSARLVPSAAKAPHAGGIPRWSIPSSRGANRPPGAHRGSRD